MTDIFQKQVTIADGQTTSDAINLEGSQLAGIIVPAGFDGTGLQLTASDKIDGTYVAVQASASSSSAFAITTTASRFIPLDNLAITAALQFIKLVAGTSQTGDIILTLLLRPVQ